MNIRHLEFFIAVVEFGSVNAAAKELNVTQPAVSVALRKLEEELGVILFVRDSRGMKLSADGRTFLEPARSFINSCNAIKNRAGKSDSVIRIIANPILSSYMTNNVFVNFMKMHKDIYISTFSDSIDNALKRIRQNEVDIAVFSYGDEINLDSRLKSYKQELRFLCPDRRKLFMSASHHYASRRMLTLEDLQHINIFFYASGRDLIAEYYSTFITFNNVYRIGSRDDILDLVLHGEGAFFQPALLFGSDERVRQGLIVGKDIDVPGINNSINAFARLCHDNPSEKVLRLYNYILKYFERIRKEIVVD